MTDKKLDQKISDWLQAEAPKQVSDRVLRATFERTRKAGQQVGWHVLLGRLTMPRFAPALASAAIVLVAVVAVGVYLNRPSIGVEPSPTSSASPSTAPLPSPTPSALTSKFTSTVHGVSIEYPSDWQVKPATEAWDRDAYTFDAPGVDVIFDPTHQDDLYLSIASAPLRDQSAEDWCCSELWAAAQVCETGGNFGRITFDGAAATIRGCDGVGNNFEDHVVQAATTTHGYVIYLHVAENPSLQAIYTEAWFDAVLDTIDLP